MNRGSFKPASSNAPRKCSSRETAMRIFNRGSSDASASEKKGTMLAACAALRSPNARCVSFGSEPSKSSDQSNVLGGLTISRCESRAKMGCVRSGTVVKPVGEDDQSIDASIERRRRFVDRRAQNSFLLLRGFAQQVRDERLGQTEMTARARAYDTPEVR